MKRAILTLLAFSTAILSCSKQENGHSQQELPKHIISFETGPVVPDDGSTKVQDNISGTKHSFTWQAGDKIRLFAFKTPANFDESNAEDEDD